VQFNFKGDYNMTLEQGIKALALAEIRQVSELKRKLRKGYTVVSVGALPSAVKPQLERTVNALYNDERNTNRKHGTGRQVTTKRTRIG